MPTLEVAPVLSTPDTHIFHETDSQVGLDSTPRLSDEYLQITYEIQRTVDEIRAGRWRRIALQFPDHMLLDAPRVFTALSRGLRVARRSGSKSSRNVVQLEEDSKCITSTRDLPADMKDMSLRGQREDYQERLYILADTSYGACCVDEVAAEHADADVVVHYGRSCLSPTARLPVIYVFTKPSLDVSTMAEAFRRAYGDLEQKIIIMADIPFVSYVPEVAAKLRSAGYTGLFETAVVHDTASPLPNRTVPEIIKDDIQALREYHIFHISDPPPSLLLTLSSRVSTILVYPTTIASTSCSTVPVPISSVATLRRRYALLTSITTVPIFGILVNTLSVKNYMHILSHIKRMIASAGKKSYTFVVGKVNAAKVANFAEVGAWVVIGCWESSLFDSKDFWKPVITPFELELALQSDSERIWTGQWRSDFQAILEEAKQKREEAKQKRQFAKPEQEINTNGREAEAQGNISNSEDASEEESEAPEFDLRTGRYVSHSRPMNKGKKSHPVQTRLSNGNGAGSQSLTTRARRDLAVIGGEMSPAADFFQNKRSWRGLGSDLEVAYEGDTQSSDILHEGAVMEQGRSGIARGYAVGEASIRR